MLRRNKLVCFRRRNKGNICKDGETGSTVVEHSTHYAKIESSNPTIGTGRMLEKSIVDETYSEKIYG
jgi:hypothetical protein